MSRAIDNYKWDQHIREGIEYLDSFWSLIPKYLRMRELEREFEVSLLIREHNEFHRRCVDNDKPGKRHMLPFIWSRRFDYEGKEHWMQIPIKIGTPAYERKMGELRDKIMAARRG